MDSNHHDDELLFAPDEEISPAATSPTHAQEEPYGYYTVLIVDDEQEVHSITKLVLRDYTFEGKGLKLLSAYSAEEAKKIMAETKNIALILLDVVMESDNAGLNLVKYIRQDTGNAFVRIILRTGQPGQAPEREVIVNYDINDYKEKTELTAGKLFTTVTSALRNYRDLITIDESRKGLRTVIDATAHLFEPKSLSKFADGVLQQLYTLLHLTDESSFMHVSSLAVSSMPEQNYRIISATGDFLGYVGLDIDSIASESIRNLIKETQATRTSCITDNQYLGYFETSNGSRNIVYIEGARLIGELERRMLEIFSNNVAIAFDNIYLNEEIVETQKNIVYMLGEAVERRSKETGNHVRRMTELSCMIAEKMGFAEPEIRLLHLAAPLHDMGKIAIPDAILHKPGSLTKDEFDLMKTHTTEGHAILKGSEQKVLKAAATIALQHHEKWDGSGYPQGLSGEEIHIFGRVCALADVVDALGHDRCYKSAWTLDKILELIQKERGKHFDPCAVDAFMDSLDTYEKINATHPSKV